MSNKKIFAVSCICPENFEYQLAENKQVKRAYDENLVGDLVPVACTQQGSSLFLHDLPFSKVIRVKYQK